MPIDMSEWEDSYKKGTAAKASKLVDKYVKTTGKLEALTSAEAQENWVAAISDPVTQARRMTNLKRLSESDLNEGMRKKGAAAYTAGTAAAAGKAKRNFEPFARKIDEIKETLPARTLDAATNVTARVLPIATGLEKLKKDLSGA